MSNTLDVLQERGFVQQCTDEAALHKVLDQPPVVFYCGFDPTADSLHCGSLVPIMAMAHLQRAGHTPIAVIGGGTALVGDPSGKTELRKLLSPEEIARNGQGILAQIQRYLTLDGTRGLFVNNADWLGPLRYIDFLRDIGRHFRVNEMLRAEAYKQRLEREEGLSFIEFNYQLLQAYDFLKLYQQHRCVLQIGGDDQWSNILAGTDLIRKLEAKTAWGLTFPLLTTARGDKMGKTAQGAVWLAAERTSPYDFYQYWINTDDRDLERFLAYFTFLPMDEVRRLSRVEGSALQASKAVLAFEATKLCHGEAEAEKARQASLAAFAKSSDDLSAMPTTVLPRAKLAAGIPIAEVLLQAGLVESKKEARRLIEQGGAYLNGKAVTQLDFTVREDCLENGAILLRHGKKKFHRIVVQD
ncbi:MAG: tyrosine--tRNA ligase [Gemmataceae bacterium]|nr:tyrosine--tRNA ligase [Gemmataceae bacterium]